MIGHYKANIRALSLCMNVYFLPEVCLTTCPMALLTTLTICHLIRRVVKRSQAQTIRPD